ncbi:MAG: GNAT family N-acetyltransferase [Candidatus Limnocylindrales bacterium]
MRVGDLELRPATLDDAGIAADVETECAPDDPEDPQMTRHWWSLAAEEDTAERQIALLDGAPVGFTEFEHRPWSKMPERFADIHAALRPAANSTERLNMLFDHLEERARSDGARKVSAWAWDWNADRLSLLEQRGYREERRERYWELDLVAGRERIIAMAAESRLRMAREGVRLLTLAKDDDPAKWEKLKRMSDEAESDVPTTVPWVRIEMDEFMEWFESPALHKDRIWIAREGDDIVGISQLTYPPVRGPVATDWTGMARKARGRGIARALKCETLLQAIALGVDTVRTDNDSTNAPILHINETMGYVRRPDQIQLLKEL